MLPKERDILIRVLVIIVIAGVLLFIRKQSKQTSCLVILPESIKCFFNEKDCKKGDITWINTIEFILSIAAGYFIPNYYIMLLLFVMFLELVANRLELQTQILLRILIFTTGYFIGTYLRSKRNQENLDFKYPLKFLN